MRRLTILFFIAIALSANEISYVGSSTIGGTILPKLSRDFSEKTDIKFNKIDVPGSGSGIKALLSGKTSLAGISRNIKDKERAKELRFFIIAYDAIGVVVNNKNSIKDLTKKQLKKIFSGEITNWSEVGGKDLPIKTVTELLGAKRATQVVFTQLIFKTKTLIGTYGINNIEVDKPVDIVNFVSQNEGAIGATSMVFVKEKPGVHSIGVNGIRSTEKNIADGSYSLSRPLKLVTKKNIDNQHMQFLNYVYSKEAQKYINQTFVAVKVDRK
ncbi:substrate-binding domain-containing protein [Sulfurospirillum sp.]|nr:substrate-binding domain-containing protein [Sulfurospirillum sp.]